jgi:hypothetical protein
MKDYVSKAKAEYIIKENFAKDVQFKKFSSEELLIAGSNKSILAFTTDYRKKPIREIRITTGNNLCHFLGFEKAFKSVISNELFNFEKTGMVIKNKYFLPEDSREVETSEFNVEDKGISVRKFNEITCVKLKITSTEDSKKKLKLMDEEIFKLADDSLTTKSDSDKRINNGPRTNSAKPVAYPPPDWAKGSESISK